MFDENERKTIEDMGLNCLFIEESNKDKKMIELDFLDKEDIFFTEKIKQASLYSAETFQDFNISFYGFPILALDPRYWNDVYIDIINKYHVVSLIFSEFLTAFLKKQTIEKEQLTNIDFLKQTPSLKQFYIQNQKDMIFEECWNIEDFTPLEYLQKLECLSISNNRTMVDIDFSKLKELKEVNLQYPKENKTIYKCQNIEEIYTRYYEKSLNVMKNWKKLKYFSAYCDNLESFAGLDIFNELEISKVEITSKFKTFEECNSESIKIFYIYTEARKTPKTLKGLSGLTRVENIAINGLKQLESIDDLQQCDSLKELTFENCKIPDDILMLNKLLNLEKLVFDDCKDIESLQFVRELPNLKYLSFSGNTKVIDGNLDFLKELADTGVEIHLTNRKHYSIKYKDLYS